MKGDTVLEAIRAEDSKDLAFLKTLFRQTGRRAPHRIFELVKGQRAAGRPVDERRLVLELARRLKDEVGDRDFRDGNVRIWPAKDHSSQCAP